MRFYDTTLRDGEQTVGVIFSPQQKLEIAKKLDELGVGRIEAGFPKVSKEDGEAISMILQAGLKHSEVWGFARATRGDVEELAPPRIASLRDRSAHQRDQAEGLRHFPR